MRNEDEKYGTYYGKLIPMETLIREEHAMCSNGPQTPEETKELYEKLTGFGCKDIMVDYDEDQEGSDTVFFSIRGTIDFNGLLVYLVKMRPNEFSEESTNHFRIWWD